jgi:predicted nucleic acid-binding protein
MLIGRYSGVLDACVLHPAILMGSLLWLAAERLYRPIWSDTILDEWQRSLEKRFGEGDESIKTKRQLIESQFPEARVEPPEALFDCLKLPDKNDRHVLSAALVAKADAIITTNLKHFPAEICDPLDVEIIHPDKFLVNAIDLEPERALKAFQKQRAMMKKSGIKPEEFVQRFEKSGLTQTHERLKALTDVL